MGDETKAKLEIPEVPLYPCGKTAESLKDLDERIAKSDADLLAKSNARKELVRVLVSRITRNREPELFIYKSLLEEDIQRSGFPIGLIITLFEAESSTKGLEALYFLCEKCSENATENEEKAQIRIELARHFVNYWWFAQLHFTTDGNA